MSTITQADAIEAIWDAVQSAADGYHNTQQWGEEGHFAPDVSYWKQIRAAVDLAKSLAPTPAAPEPPVPVDLDFEAVRCEIYHKDPKAMAELDKIEKAFAALRSRLSEAAPAAAQGGDTREAVAKHIRKTRFFNEDQEARAPKWEDLPKDFKDIFYGEADKILSLIQPSLTDAGQEDALQSLGNLLDFIDLKKDELLGLCENPGRLEECIDAARSLIEPQHPGEAK